MLVNSITCVIFVVTNYGKPLTNGDTNAGWNLPEAAEAFNIFKEVGYAVKFVSPKGGKAPMEENKLEKNPFYEQFKLDCSEDLIKTLSPAEVNASDCKGLFYVGGHGPMFDIANDMAVATLARDIYENDGILGAVGHGVAGLLPVKLSTGEFLVKGQTVTSFTNDEEDALKLSQAMPFMLETRLMQHGADFHAGKIGECHVEVSERLVTGQNPNSAAKCAREMLDLIRK